MESCFRVEHDVGPSLGYTTARAEDMRPEIPSFWETDSCDASSHPFAHLDSVFSICGEYSNHRSEKLGLDTSLGPGGVRPISAAELFTEMAGNQGREGWQGKQGRGGHDRFQPLGGRHGKGYQYQRKEFLSTNTSLERGTNFNNGGQGIPSNQTQNLSNTGTSGISSSSAQLILGGRGHGEGGTGGSSVQMIGSMPVAVARSNNRPDRDKFLLKNWV